MIWNNIIGVVVLRQGQQQTNKLSKQNHICISEWVFKIHSLSSLNAFFTFTVYKDISYKCIVYDSGRAVIF